MRLDDALVSVHRLGIDTAPVIYLIEAHPRYEPVVVEIARRISATDLTAITSVVTFSEVLVQPFARGDLALGRRYREILLNSRGLHTHPIDSRAAEYAARLRAQYGIRLPDALQIAVALQARCEAFLTNDRRLERITDLRVLILDDLDSERTGRMSRWRRMELE